MSHGPSPTRLFGIALGPSRNASNESYGPVPWIGLRRGDPSKSLFLQTQIRMPK